MNSKAKQRAAVTGSGRRADLPDPGDTEPEAGEEVRQRRPDHDGPALVGLQSFTIQADQEGKRLDRFLADHLTGEPGLSRTRLQALIAGGFVAIDDRPVTQASTRLEQAGRVTVDIPLPAAAEPEAQPIPLSIVYEDAHLLVLDKPAGLVVHPAAGHEDGTLVNALIAHCGASLSGIGGVRRPGIVHRLDKDTSGLMVVAKTDRAHGGLAELFADHGRSGSLERAYTAFVWGVPGTRAGTVDLPLGRHAHQREKMAVVAAGRGRTAVTHWTVLASHPTTSIVQCRLETGRTHQIRVHLTEIGHPLIGDPVYGTGFKTKATRLPPAAQAAIAALGRQALHASLLGFEHPVTGEPLRFESPLPGDLTRLAAALEQAGTDSRTVASA